jgi:lipopolysaccharide export system permease protein
VRRLDITLFRDIALPFLAGLGFLFVILFSIYFLQGASVLIGGGSRAVDLVRMFSFLAPHFLTVAMPIALLLAVLVALGRMAEDNEVISLASAGVSPLRLFWVPLSWGVAASIVGLLLSVFVEPGGRRAARMQVSELIKRNVAAEVEGGVFYEELGEVVLYAERTDPATGEWNNVFVQDERDRDAPLILIAPRGKFDPGAGGQNLDMRLENGEVHRSANAGDDYAVAGFDHADLSIEMQWSNFARGRFANRADEASIAELEQAAREAPAHDDNPRRYLMRIYRRFADPLAALVFSMIGVPVGIYRRRASRAAGLAATTLCAVAYYILGRVGTMLGESGMLPGPSAANLSNVIVAAVAIVLLVRVARAGPR